MGEVKRCKQCGILKDAGEFRQYTYSKKSETPGRFSICRSCENINSRYKRLNEQSKFSNVVDYAAQQAELSRIEELYKMLESRGFHTPLSRQTRDGAPEESTTKKAIDNLMSFYSAQPANCSKKSPAPTETKVEVPKELNQWLAEDTTVWREKEISPEFLQETIYESLKAKYRPQIGMDQEMFIPIYDDTYKDILQRILRKFDDYEEEIAVEYVDAE